MAILPSDPWKRNPFDEVDNLTFTDYAIGGKLLTVTYRMSPFEETQMIDSTQKAFLKQKIAVLLAEVMIEKKLIEFTQIHDPLVGTKVNARCYLVPDEQVKLLRLYNAT
jgi:hypothetical protein